MAAAGLSAGSCIILSELCLHLTAINLPLTLHSVCKDSPACYHMFIQGGGVNTWKQQSERSISSNILKK